MTIASVLRDKGNAVETIACRRNPLRCGRKARREEDRGASGGRCRANRRHHVRARRHLLPRDHGPDVLDWPVEPVMSSPAITADSNTDVLAALALMTQRRIRHLPVVEGGQIRGIVSIGDLVKHRMERIEAEAEAMRAYIQSA